MTTQSPLTLGVSSRGAPARLPASVCQKQGGRGGGGSQGPGRGSESRLG